jgi:formylglycine-generating enzyme required for sulfatase activity
MMALPAGSFVMGSPLGEHGRKAAEGPQHSVRIPRGFAVSRDLVTFDEWNACAAEGACSSYFPSDEHWGRGTRPVINVNWNDAKNYVAWLSAKTGHRYRLPTEAEWEYAARGGLEGAIFTWGDDPAPKGRAMANTWQGEFPWQNLLTDGYEGTSPVGRYPANGYGLHDMTGNVWEWTDDFFTSRHVEPAPSPCCAPRNPRVFEPAAGSYGSGPGAAIPRRVIKGGSHLCAPNYCLRYRPAARQGEAIDTSTSHIGFRCVVRDA